MKAFWLTDGNETTDELLQILHHYGGTGIVIRTYPDAPTDQCVDVLIRYLPSLQEICFTSDNLRSTLKLAVGGFEGYLFTPAVASKS